MELGKDKDTFMSLLTAPQVATNCTKQPKENRGHSYRKLNLWNFLKRDAGFCKDQKEASESPGHERE